MRKLITIFLAVLAVVAVFSVKAEASVFLKIAPGAAGSGSGGARTASAGDLGALYYNPAGLGSIRGTQIGGGHLDWLGGMSFNYAAGALRFKDGVMGISATFLGYGDMDGRDESGEESGNFGVGDFALQVSYGREGKEGLSLGGGVKYIKQSIGEDTAAGFAADMGILKKMGGKLSLGMSLRNLGPSMKFISEEYSLPLTLSLGGGYEIGGMRLALDGIWGVNDKSFKLSFGTEYLPADFITLRGGYLLKLAEGTGPVSGGEGNFGGLGGGIGFSALNYSIDYSYEPFGELGSAQRFSITGRF